MRFSRISIYLLLALVSVACSSTEQATQQQPIAGSAVSGSPSAINLLDKMPAADRGERQWIFAELVSTGPAGIQSLTNMLVPPGSGNDTQARFAVNGLAKYVSQAGMESEQIMFEDVLLKGLQSNYQPAVKGFLMEQLELIGSEQSIPVLKSFLGAENLHKSAVHALRSINSQRAQQTLVQALTSTRGAKRSAIIKTLGAMQVTTAALD